MSHALDRETIVAWIESIRAQFRAEIPEIAKQSKVSASTIYRWLDGDYAFNPSMTSLRKISDAFGVPMPGGKDSRPNPSGDGDVRRLEAQPGIVLPPEQSRWIITSRVLELAGMLPGDEILTDSQVQPRPGDVVCAHVRDIETGQPKTRLRLFDPPYLITRTMDPAANDRPLYVDNERIFIMGTVVHRSWTRPM